MLLSSLSKVQFLLRQGSLLMKMEILFLNLLSETQVLGLKKRISLKYFKFLGNQMQPLTLTPPESAWDYPHAKRLQRLFMGKYLLLTIKKKFSDRSNFIPIGQKFLQEKRILMINPNQIFQVIIIIKKVNNQYYLNNLGTGPLLGFYSNAQSFCTISVGRSHDSSIQLCK